jgi:hypothetical protein
MMKILAKIIILAASYSLVMAQLQPFNFRPFATMTWAPFPQFPPIQNINGNQQSPSQLQIQVGGGSQSQSQSGSGSQVQVQTGNSGSQIQAQTGGGSQIQVQPSNGRPIQTQTGNGIQIQIPNRNPRSKRESNNNPLQNFLSLQSQEHAFTIDALKTIIESIKSNKNNLQTLVTNPSFRAQITGLTNQRNRIDRLVQSLQLLPAELKSVAKEVIPEIDLNELQQSANAVLNYLNLSQISRFNPRTLLNNLSNFEKFAHQLENIQNAFPTL